MSGFFKTVSSLRQNFFACLPAMRLRCLKSQGGFRQRGLGQKEHGPGYQLVLREGPRLCPLGVGRITELDVFLSESAYFLCRTALARHALQA